MHKALTALIFGLFLTPVSFAQDTLAGIGPVNGYTGQVFDTTKAPYDYLVDGAQAADPAKHRFQTVEAAYAAAPAGTPGHPTVIAIKPGVYLLPGHGLESGLTITKPDITLIGLTDDRRKVVLADNRGNQEGAGVLGASNNGYTMIVHADGFSAINLTIANFCNMDYDYPGDPSKSLKKRSDVITQAVALEASGDRHVYSHVAILSRLDTMFLRTKRAYLTHVYVEGTDDYIGGGDASLWEDSEIHFITGGGVMFARGSAFLRTVFKATKPMAFYKIDSAPVALLDSTLPNVPVAWMAWPRPKVINNYSLLYHTKHADGRIADPIDSFIGPERRTMTQVLNDQQAEAFNAWNMLHATPDGVDDGWDPAGVRAKYEALGPQVFRLTMTGGAPVVRTGGKGAEIAVSVLPKAAEAQPIHWVAHSALVTLSADNGNRITITGSNHTSEAETVAVDAIAADGLRSTAYVTVEPPFVAPPVFTAKPVLHGPAKGRVTVAYALPLGKAADQSAITWSLCSSKACTDARVIAVSRGEPLKTLVLPRGAAGKFLQVTVVPKLNISEPGEAVTTVSSHPIAPGAAAPVDLVFRNFSATPATIGDGLWAMEGDWSVTEPGDALHAYGLRSGPKGGTLFYRQPGNTGDMVLTVAISPEKREGQVFSVPGAPDDAQGPRADIFFKYDPLTKTGYALRIWRTTLSAGKCMFQIFRITDGHGEAVSEANTLSGVFKPTTTITITVKGSHVAVRGSNTLDGETLALDDVIPPNAFGGAGIFWSRSGNGGSVTFSKMTLDYPNH